MLLSAILPFLAILAPLAKAADVFAHYMIQGLDSSTDHAAQDVKTALSLGFTAFALNIGTPSAGWALDAIDQLFTAAASTGFKLFFSLDMAQDSNPNDFASLVNEYIGNSAYYLHDNKPFLSTFWSGGHDPTYWGTFLNSLNRDVYFVPNFDDTTNYYTDINSWLTTWSATIDGAFSWETAWPAASDAAANVSTSTDETILTAVQSAQRSYMIGLSSLQYKHWSGNHYYRVGEVNLPQRMAEILALNPKPDFVEVMTWNDAGESHYIGTLWYEGLTTDITAYANNDKFPHTGWQPLFASFIKAYKNNADASAMRPFDGSNVVGAMWYRTILANAPCSSDSLGRPAGAGAARDAVNWAIVVNDGVSDIFAQVWSNGVLIYKYTLSTGLNYFSTPGMQTGIQYLEVIDASNKILMSAQGSIEVTADSSGVCNFNYQVDELQIRT